VTRAPTDRSHLSIGEVLSLLHDEFPDVTISKIRFLESQGLLDPERTPSGYRKFYEADIDRLRWILRMQKDHYLPLKVIKDRLDELGPVRTAPTAASSALHDPTLEDEQGPGPDAAAASSAPAAGHAPAQAMATAAAGARNGQGSLLAVALDDRPDPADPGLADPGDAGPSDPGGAPLPRSAPSTPPVSSPAPARPEQPVARTGNHRAGVTRRPDVADVIEAPQVRGPVSDPAGRAPAGPGRATGAGAPPASAGQAGSRGSVRRAAAPAESASVSLTDDELLQASGLPARALRELEGYGLIESHRVGDAVYYDADALTIARTAAAFLEHGIEARHIRSYKVAAEREAGLFEQIVLPLLKQRNPDARRRADQTVAELVRLGDEMRRVLLRRGLRDHIPPH
jgi:DNA-binding transcriptional MerR regulator